MPIASVFTGFLIAEGGVLPRWIGLRSRLLFSLYPVQTYSWWVLWLGIMTISIGLVWVGWLLIRYRLATDPSQKFDEPTLADITSEMRQRYDQQIGEIAEFYQEGRYDLRDVHLSLSALMRALATERSGIDLEVATNQEVISRFRQWPALGQFLKRCEQPSFSAEPQEVVDRSIAEARQVLAQ